MSKVIGCELCGSPAKIHCESDGASLCWNCDGKVHGANFLVGKHIRTLLCHRCQSPSPWTSSGPKLPPSFSFCLSCLPIVESINTPQIATNHPDEEEEEEQVQEDDDFGTYSDDDDDDDDEDDDDDCDEDDDENQVVPGTSSSEIKDDDDDESEEDDDDDDDEDENNGKLISRSSNLLKRKRESTSFIHTLPPL